MRAVFVIKADDVIARFDVLIDHKSPVMCAAYRAAYGGFARVKVRTTGPLTLLFIRHRSLGGAPGGALALRWLGRGDLLQQIYGCLHVVVNLLGFLLHARRWYPA